jgi:hypothetical protein
MLRSSLLWLAALFAAAFVACAPAGAGGYFGGGWYGVSHWEYYGGRFVPSAMPGHLHEYAAFNPSCVYLRRVVLTPVGPSRQLVPVCF